jgi:hypothetical protein
LRWPCSEPPSRWRPAAWPQARAAAGPPRYRAAAAHQPDPAGQQRDASSPSAVTKLDPMPPLISAPPAPEPGSQPAGAGECTAADLNLAIGPAGAAAGSFYYPLEFTNVSGAACTMDGYPAVGFVTAPGGAAIGSFGTRDPAFPAEPVTLAPGVTVHASLQVAVAANYPAQVCDPVAAHWLEVYPPGSLRPLYASFTAQTCTGSVPSGTTLGIFVVRPGATGP